MHAAREKQLSSGNTSTSELGEHVENCKWQRFWNDKLSSF